MSIDVVILLLCSFVCIVEAALYNSSVTVNNFWELVSLDHKKYPMARCLDGSYGAFWFHSGSGSGLSNYIVYLQGGGWCTTENECLGRSLDKGFDSLGSSNAWRNADCNNLQDWSQPCNSIGYQGLSSSDPAINPVSHNWNKIFVGYCDGGSYTGNVKNPLTITNQKDKKRYEVFLRGKHIIDGVVETLLHDYGMSTSRRVVIAGSSAGGLAVYLQVDRLAEKIRKFCLKNNLHTIVPQIFAVPDAG